MIGDVDKFKQKTGMSNSTFVKALNIFEALAVVKQLTIHDAFELERIWGRDYVAFADEDEFFKQFKVKLQVWILDVRNTQNKGVLIYGNAWEESDVLRLLVDSTWDFETERISIQGYTRLVLNPSILNHFPCQFQGCDFIADGKQLFDKHNKAHDKDRIECVQMAMRADTITGELIREGMLPPGFREKFALFWDIESFMHENEKGFGHKAVSIGVTRNFGQVREFFFYRKSMESSALKDMVKEFVDFLDQSYAEFEKQIPGAIWAHIGNLSKRLADKTLSVTEKAKISRNLRRLRDIASLKMYSYYGERYDVPVLKSALFDELFQRDPEFSALLRGCGIMQFRYKRIIARDAGWYPYNINYII